ncbi:hypothetical protein TYRP_018213, partial [Tyrophagus putrescentiae]
HLSSSRRRCRLLLDRQSPRSVSRQQLFSSSSSSV